MLTCTAVCRRLSTESSRGTRSGVPSTHGNFTTKPLTRLSPELKTPKSQILHFICHDDVDSQHFLDPT